MTTMQLFGMEVSPYAVKVRALLRHKGIAHQWLPRSRRYESAFRAKAKLPLIPLLVIDEEAFQDSTPILDMLEQRYPTNSIHLADASMNWLSRALEEAADEWAVKPMFHYRWQYEADRINAGMRIARASVEPGTDPAPFAGMISAHLMTRLPTLGCTDHNKAVLESYVMRGAALIDEHMKNRAYLFGGQLSYADLGLGCMYYQLMSDPTPRALLQPYVALQDWVMRCMNPTDQGDAEPMTNLLPTLAPILAHELQHHYLPWAQENTKAFANEHSDFTCSLGSTSVTYTQPTQKYSVKSFAQLQATWQALTPAQQQTLLATLPWLNDLTKS
ncbi:MAG: glutathione S-transferase family protein [Moraxellaceae bacterium]|nr:glutathione S-transferase family protein [Moraxellaceae bacterium]